MLCGAAAAVVPIPGWGGVAAASGAAAAAAAADGALTLEQIQEAVDILRNHPIGPDDGHYYVYMHPDNVRALEEELETVPDCIVEVGEDCCA